MPTRLRPLNAAGGIAIGVLTFATVGTGLAGAQTGEEEPIEISPSSGPPGTAIHVSGSGCTGDVSVLLTNGDTLDEAELEGITGDWEATVTVPEDDDLRGLDLAVTAVCIGEGPEYGAANFTVDEETTPPSTDPPSTSPTTAPSGPGAPGAPPGGSPGQPGTTAASSGGSITTRASSGPRTMPPATPVRGQPNFTG